MMGLAHFVLASRAARLTELEGALRRRPGGEWRSYRPGQVVALWHVRADAPENQKVQMVVNLDERGAFESALHELDIGGQGTGRAPQ